MEFYTWQPWSSSRLWGLFYPGLESWEHVLSGNKRTPKPVSQSPWSSIPDVTQEIISQHLSPFFGLGMKWHPGNHPLSIQNITASQCLLGLLKCMALPSVKIHTCVCFITFSSHASGFRVAEPAGMWAPHSGGQTFHRPLITHGHFFICVPDPRESHLCPGKDLRFWKPQCNLGGKVIFLFLGMSELYFIK